MLRLTAMLTVLLATALAVGDVHAQGKQGKKSARCVPNFFQACMKKCVSSGGRQNLCPDYCNKRKAELGC